MLCEYEPRTGGVRQGREAIVTCLEIPRCKVRAEMLGKGRCRVSSEQLSCFRGTQALLLALQTATGEPGGLESLSASPPQKQETQKPVLIGLRVSLHIPNILRARFRAGPVK